MQPSQFNVQVPLPERNEVFLMNTLSDAQLIVSSDVAGLLERVARGSTTFSHEEREAVDSLAENGFIVESRDDERQSLTEYFASMREDHDELRVTLLTTLQCNFACDYCIQGDHGDHNLFANKMSLDTAARLADWIGERLDEVRPRRFVLTFFGGEPLLNLPVVYYLSERCHRQCAEQGVQLAINMITNGLLLTEDVVDRLVPYGLNGVKITLDGDRDTHNRMRPLRGRQGTFDRIINNIRKVAGKCAITIGGNFDASSVDSYPALLDFLREQEFGDKIAMVNFKPIIEVKPSTPNGIIPLSLVNTSGKPLNGACMSGAGAGTDKPAGACDSCHFVDEKMAVLRSEARKRGFKTPDGVHMGPCEIHKRHSYTIGVDGSVLACPGFGSETSQAIGHIDGRQEEWRTAVAERFERLNPLKEECGDCSFIPVCGGGCSVAAHHETGDLHAASCHKTAFESSLISLAERSASAVN